MSKYKGAYKCLICGRASVLPSSKPIEIPEERVKDIVAFMAKDSNNPEEARKHWPSVITHDCMGNGRNIGAAVFAGVVRVDEKGEDDGSDPRE